MGMISSLTPSVRNCSVVPKVTVSSKYICEVSKVKISFCQGKYVAMPNTRYEAIQVIDAEDPTAHLNSLWKASMLMDLPWQSWSGMMQAVHSGSHPGMSSIVFLPIINMDPTNMSCIYSTLHFLCDQARKCNTAPIITFDQPLWWKSRTIIDNESTSSELKSIVLRLGGLHVQMSFLGCIGHLMTDSGLKELLQVIYAENAVGHILKGAAVSRAIRGHILVIAALHHILLSGKLGSDDLFQLTALQQALIKCEKSVTDVCLDESLKKLHNYITETKQPVTSQHTATLWLQYI